MDVGKVIPVPTLLMNSIVPSISLSLLFFMKLGVQWLRIEIPKWPEGFEHGTLPSRNNPRTTWTNPCWQWRCLTPTPDRLRYDFEFCLSLLLHLIMLCAIIPIIIVVGATIVREGMEEYWQRKLKVIGMKFVEEGKLRQEDIYLLVQTNADRIVVMENDWRQRSN